MLIEQSWVGLEVGDVRSRRASHTTFRKFYPLTVSRLFAGNLGEKVKFGTLMRQLVFPRTMLGASLHTNSSNLRCRKLFTKWRSFF